MNIEKTQLNNVKESNGIKPAGKNDFGIKFSDELNELKNSIKEPESDKKSDLKENKAKEIVPQEKGTIQEEDKALKNKSDNNLVNQKLSEMPVSDNKNYVKPLVEEENIKKTKLAQNNPFQEKITPEDVLKSVQTENLIKNDVIKTKDFNLEQDRQKIDNENIQDNLVNNINNVEENSVNNTIQKPEIVTMPKSEIEPIIEQKIIPEINPEKEIEKPVDEVMPKEDIKPDVQSVIRPEIDIKQPVEQKIQPEINPEKEIEKAVDEVMPKEDIKPDVQPAIKPEIDIKPQVEQKIQLEINPEKEIEKPVDEVIQKPKEEIKPKKEFETKEEVVQEVKIVEDVNIKSDSKEDKTANFDDTLGIHIAIADMKNIVNRLKQADKPKTEKTDTKKRVKDSEKEDDKVINNDFSINENQNKLPQMTPNMNFSGDGQPFSSFVNQEEQQQSNQKLSLNKADLEEEAKILSTMEENIQIANKNIIKNKHVQAQEILKPENVKVEKEPDKVEEKVVSRNDGVKKIDTKTGVTIENIVKYDNIIVTKEDADLFIDIVNNSEVNLNDYTEDSVKKATQISKTLADMLAKAKENNQPLRIDFDNNISVIIKISRDGKISADFLPSSQVAETYLKENLPLLKQRFDENNIEYDELNQRGRREQEREDRQRKDRNHE